MTLRLGSPESEKEGVVIEKSNHGLRVTIRAWHGGGTTGGVHLIRPIHFSLAEISAFLGLDLPQPGTIKPRRKRGRHIVEEIPA